GFWVGKGCTWEQWGWKGLGEGEILFHGTSTALGGNGEEGVVSREACALGRLCARCGSLGTVGTDGGGTGKRDRKRVPGGKCRVQLSRPRTASGIRPGRGAVAGPVGLGTGWWPVSGLGGFGRWLCPGKGRRLRGTPSPAGIPRRAPRCSSPGSAWQQRRQGGHPGLDEGMEEDNRTETWHRSLQAVLNALNQTLHGVILCPTDRPATTTATARNASARPGRPGRNDNAYMYILFVMTLFAATVGSLILGYTRSRKVDKRSDPYHVYIKNRVSMI
uniref:Potassium voltage-gated channel subfamily E member 3 n=2 Tax=Falco TaxID=8952 RepID=A0A8C4UUH3_FALTI